MDRAGRREKCEMERSLASLVNGLAQTYTTVDLRNNTCLTGKIVKTDACMNMEMEDVIFYDARGEEHYFRTYFLTARNIRYVHIPPDISPEETIRKSWETPRVRQVKNQRTFKQARSQKYQKSILKDLKGPSTSRN